MESAVLRVGLVGGGDDLRGGVGCGDAGVGSGRDSSGGCRLHLYFGSAVSVAADGSVPHLLL